MTEPFFHTTCPSCGAPVNVHSATSVTVVCSYCSSLLSLHDGSLHDTGRDSALLEDFSPLQIGTVGQFSGENFSVIGRLQAKYDAGVWNEWYLRFDNGKDGWLSEAGDLYTLTQPCGTPPDAPEFDTIQAGIDTLDFGKRFVASDVRHITLSNAAAQGELPFDLPENLQNRVADWRCENAFLTLDYGTTPPEAFLGRTVALVELRLQNTRSETQIRESAGSLKGERKSENCPNCGATVQWIGGITPTVICPSCGSDLDTGSDTAKLIAADEMRKAQLDALPLPIGATGGLNGKRYTVIGMARYDELSPQDAHAALYGSPLGFTPQGWWREYLLYAPEAGFLWLVETPDDGWSISETQADFPQLDRNGIPVHSEKLYDYGGRVSIAAGAFYWHIRKGDITYYQDFRQGGGKLCAERTRSELAWSKSTPLPYAKLAQAFRLKNADGTPYTAKMQPDPVSHQLVYLMLGIFVIINIPAWIMMDSDDLFFSLILSGIIGSLLYKVSGIDDDD